MSKFKYEFNYDMSHLIYTKPIVPDVYDMIARHIIRKEDAIDILVQEYRRDISEYIDELIRDSGHE